MSPHSSPMPAGAVWGDNGGGTASIDRAQLQRAANADVWINGAVGESGAMLRAASIPRVRPFDRAGVGTSAARRREAATTTGRNPDLLLADLVKVFTRIS